MRPPRLLLSVLSLLLVGLAWPHLFLKSQVPVDGNVLRLVYPNWVFLHAHPPLPWRWPLWNPCRNMGEPFLADPQAMAAYPPMWILCRLPTYLDFFRVWVLAHTFLAAFFMAKWMMRVTEIPAAAAASAIALAFNGYTMAHASLPNHFAAAAYVPAVLYFFDSGAAIPVAAALALQWLAGFPPISYLTVLILLFWCVLSGSSRWKILFRAGVLALGLASIQLLPFLELFFHCARPLVMASPGALDFSEPRRQLMAMIFIPHWYAWNPQLMGDQAIVSFYAGPFVLLTAVWAAWKGSRRDRIVCGAVLAGFLLSLGVYLPGYSHIAFFRVFRFPANWLLIAVTGLAYLCGMGVSHLRASRVRWTVCGLILVDLLAFAQYVRVPWFSPDSLSVPPPLATMARASSRPGRLYHPRLVTATLEKRPWRTLDDFAFLRESLLPSYGMAFGLREVSSYQVLALTRAVRFQQRLAAEGPASPLLSWADVSTVVTRKPGTDPWGPGNIQIVTLDRSRGPLFYAGGTDSGRIEQFSREPEKASAQIDARRGDTLVLSEMAYPGWTVRVDGHKADPGRFEDTFISIPVLAGRHKVEFRFVSLSFWVGLLISAALALVLILRALPRPRL